MDDKQLLEALKSANLLGDKTVDELIKEASDVGKSSEEVVYDHKFASEEEVAKVKSGILNIPYKKIDLGEYDDNILSLIPTENARTHQMIPLSEDAQSIVVGMVDPTNIQAQEALRFIAKEKKKDLGVFIVTPSDVKGVMRKFGSYMSDIQTAVDSLNLKEGEGASELQKAVKLEQGLNIEADAPVIRIVASMLKEAVNIGASDIHIEPQRSRLRIRFRLDGKLEEHLTFPPELHQPMVSRVKVLSNLRLDETRKPQDGRFRTHIFDRDIDYRVATFPTPTGEKVALRVLDPNTGLKTLEELGLIGKNAEVVDRGIKAPFGMILISGPTGSGKTTSLYAMLQMLNNEESNVVSLEDPVEYTIDGVNQSQIRPEIGYDFASGLRQILRQDPDVIMVGEIRDDETADLAVHAALTGHIVLSTIHTNNAIGVVPRLINMGVQPFLLPSVLTLMVSQRLVSRLCQKCKQQKDPAPEIIQIIKQELANMPSNIATKYKEPYKAWMAPGCDSCKKRGVSGRMAIFESFEMTPELTNIITKGGVNENDVQEEARRQEMVTMRQDGILKALDGLVSIEEIMKETSRREDVAQQVVKKENKEKEV
jgi:type IV pilus assembly protein PilB